MEEIKKFNKPPLGVMSKYSWEMNRMEALADAIKRFLDCETAIPNEWVKEYNELARKYKKEN